MQNSARKMDTADYKWLLKSIGATILGIKPAELRSVCPQEEGYTAWRKFKRQISRLDQLRIREISENQRRKKVLFYHAASLDNWLDNPQRLKILTEFDYPPEYKLQDYVSFLVTRLKEYEVKEAEFPHEIGIFLGYPLKDVLGFIDYIELELTCKSEWEIYGKKSISLSRQQEFKRAREQFAQKIKQINRLTELSKLV